MRAAKLVLAWILSGVALSTALAVLVGAAAGVLEPATPEISKLRFVAAGGVFWAYYFLSFYLLLSPAVVAVCSAWPLLVRRWPRIERPSIMLAGLVLAAILSAGGFLLFVAGPGTDLRVLTPPFLCSLAPLLIPRLVVRSLRPGSFIQLAAQQAAAALPSPPERLPARPDDI